MSSILNALKKLEDDTSEQGEGDPSLPGPPDAKQVFRKRVWKKRRKLLWGAFGMAAAVTLFWFAAYRNPATVPDQTYPQSESGTVSHSDAKPAVSESLKPALEHKDPAYAEKKAETPEKQDGISVSGAVPVHPSPAGTQENRSKFQDMLANQVKKEDKNDPFRIPHTFMEPVSTVTVVEKSHDKAVSETVKPAYRAGSTVPLLPAPEKPVKTEPVSLLPAPKNPMKPETAVPAPQPLPVPVMKKMQEAEALTVAGPPESVKETVPSEPVKKNAQTEPAKFSAPSETEGYAAVSEKTAGETGLSIQALVWSEDPAERMAVVNGSIVRQKGMVSDVSVTHIGSDYIIFQNDTAKWMQKFRLN